MYFCASLPCANCVLIGLNWFVLGLSENRGCDKATEAMAKRSWPFGVTSWDDTVKFAQLAVGTEIAARITSDCHILVRNLLAFCQRCMWRRQSVAQGRRAH